MKKKKQKILILEGIATSGKTTILNLIKTRFENKIIKIVEEDETLMPILHNTSRDIALKHLKAVLDIYLNLDFDILIFDRLYFTHIFRTESIIEEFRKIENKLVEFDCSLVFLKVDENMVLKRIQDAIEYRDIGWVKYVKSKGNFEDIEQYYINQQRELEKLVDNSKLQTNSVNVTKNNYDEVVEEIIEKFK